MPTRLTDLVIKEGALVDKGDNPLAKITFWKRRDPAEGDQMPTPEDVQKAHAETLAKKDTEIAKLKADLEATNAEVAKLKAPPPDPMAGVPAEMRKRLEDADARAAAFEKKLDEERETRLVGEFTKRAESIGTVPGMATGDVATLLKALPADSADKLEKALRASAAQARESQALMKELGRVGRDAPASGVEGPMAKIEVLAKAYAREHRVSMDAARYQVTQSGEGQELFYEARVAEQGE